MPHANLWYAWLHATSTRTAARKLYSAYKHKRAVNITGLPYFKKEMILFDLEDCLYCHKHEGPFPGGAGDILFNRQTCYYGGQFMSEQDAIQRGLGPESHGRHMFGRGAGHKCTRALSNGTAMRTTPLVLECARRCVDFVGEYPKVIDWINFHQIDMFMSVIVGCTPDLANPKTDHPLRHLPEDEEHAFVSGLILSFFPSWGVLTGLEKRFVKAMDRMTGLGVEFLRERFLSLPPEERPECFMKSLLDEGGTRADAEQFMALFITAFQGNVSLTLQNIIFHLATHPEAQEKLHRECVEAYETGDPMSAQMPYLLAIHKESHRLTPITDITQVREYDHDIELPSGYLIPKGTKVMMLNQWSTRDPDLVPNADKFIPERYLGEGVDRNLSHFLQFSEFGSSNRGCLGRRTAKIMLKSVIIELFRRYRLEATPPNQNFGINMADPTFNRIHPFPEISVHPR